MRNQVDSDFFQLLQSGNGQVMDHLFHQYHHWLVIAAHTILNHEVEAQEIVQEFFIDFWENKRYETLTFSTAEGLKNYLFICIKNRCLNRIAKNKTRKRRYQELLIPSDHILPETRLENAELKIRLDAAFDQLTSRQKEVFELGYLYDKTRKEIAAELNIAPETVKKLMAQALKTLREFLIKTKYL
ncbi:MAG TPA: sigma-70 family RNA polymerase sigma factor [Membranihabitans sp.]|nr:sigma-70 family RNA polymerase sigma factor [Membranihabitans sp.]